MTTLGTAILLTCGMLVYYVLLLGFGDLLRAGTATYTKNKTLSELRTKYGVTIRTYQKNNSSQGFAWLNSIWINENIFKRKKRLMYVFHHEYYHVKHNHKAKILWMRGGLSLTPMLLSVLHWGYVLGILLSLALVVNHIAQVVFEKNADEYANKMNGYEASPAKR